MSTMLGAHKNFDPDLYDESLLAEEVAKEFISEYYNFKIIEDGLEHFQDFDFQYIDSNIPDSKCNIFNVEVEWKRCWKEHKKWNNITHLYVPERKKHTLSHFYIMVNYFFDTIILFRSDVFLRSNLVEVETKCTKNVGKEYCFDVPWNKVYLFTKYFEDTWKAIKRDY